MTSSMTQLDTAFRGNSQRNSSISIQYNQSFRTTILQISQKLSDAFFLASTNSEKIESILLDAPEKVGAALGYLKKFKNSSRNANFFELSLKRLKENTDQTFNLSSQIVSQFSELVRLTYEVLETVNASKTEKEEQRRDVIAKLQSTQTDKIKIEKELNNIEKEIKNLKGEVRLIKAKVEAATEDWNQLKMKEEDKSKCYWSWDQNEKRGVFNCPYRPESFQIQEAEGAKQATHELFQLTMRQLDRKENEAQNKREKDNKLLIRIRKLFGDLVQLNGDIKLLETSSAIVIPLVANFRMLERNWVTLAAFYKHLQEGVTKSHASVNETITNPSSWNDTLSDEIEEQLKETRENQSLLNTIIRSYLEGYRLYIREIVAEVEQMMTKKNDPNELGRRLLNKCDAASRGIQNYIQSNSQLLEVDSQIAQKKSRILNISHVDY
jgi:copper chaperone CopZ